MSIATALNFSSTTPAAPAGSILATPQNDGGSPTCNQSFAVPAPFGIAPATLAAPNGGSTYTLPTACANPTGSFYFVNGLKRVYGTDYSISGTTLTILLAVKPDAANGDFHEIYYS